MMSEHLPEKNEGANNLFSFLAMVLHSNGREIEISSEQELAYEKWATTGDFSSCSVLRVKNEETGAISLKLIEDAESVADFH